MPEAMQKDCKRSCKHASDVLWGLHISPRRNGDKALEMLSRRATSALERDVLDVLDWQLNRAN